MLVVSLVAFVVLIASHAALYVWALTYQPVAREFQQPVNRETALTDLAVATLDMPAYSTPKLAQY